MSSLPRPPDNIRPSSTAFNQNSTVSSASQFAILQPSNTLQSPVGLAATSGPLLGAGLSSDPVPSFPDQNSTVFVPDTLHRNHSQLQMPFALTEHFPSKPQIPQNSLPAIFQSMGISPAAAMQLQPQQAKALVQRFRLNQRQQQRQQQQQQQQQLQQLQQLQQQQQQLQQLQQVQQQQHQHQQHQQHQMQHLQQQQFQQSQTQKLQQQQFQQYPQQQFPSTAAPPLSNTRDLYKPSFTDNNFLSSDVTPSLLSEADLSFFDSQILNFDDPPVSLVDIFPAELQPSLDRVFPSAPELSQQNSSTIDSGSNIFVPSSQIPWQSNTQSLHPNAPQQQPLSLLNSSLSSVIQPITASERLLDPIPDQQYPARNNGLSSNTFSLVPSTFQQLKQSQQLSVQQPVQPSSSPRKSQPLQLKISSHSSQEFAPLDSNWSDLPPDMSQIHSQAGSVQTSPRAPSAINTPRNILTPVSSSQSPNQQSWWPSPILSVAGTFEQDASARVSQNSPGTSTSLRQKFSHQPLPPYSINGPSILTPPSSNQSLPSGSAVPADSVRYFPNGISPQLMNRPQSVPARVPFPLQQEMLQQQLQNNSFKRMSMPPSHSLMKTQSVFDLDEQEIVRPSQPPTSNVIIPPAVATATAFQYNEPVISRVSTPVNAPQLVRTESTPKRKGSNSAMATSPIKRSKEQLLIEKEEKKQKKLERQRLAKERAEKKKQEQAARRAEEQQKMKEIREALAKEEKSKDLKIRTLQDEKSNLLRTDGTSFESNKMALPSPQYSSPTGAPSVSPSQSSTKLVGMESTPTSMPSLTPTCDPLKPLKPRKPSISVDEDNEVVLKSPGTLGGKNSPSSPIVQKSVLNTGFVSVNPSPTASGNNTARVNSTRLSQLSSMLLPPPPPLNSSSKSKSQFLNSSFDSDEVVMPSADEANGLAAPVVSHFKSLDFSGDFDEIFGSSGILDSNSTFESNALETFNNFDNLLFTDSTTIGNAAVTPSTATGTDPKSSSTFSFETNATDLGDIDSKNISRVVGEGLEKVNKWAKSKDWNLNQEALLLATRANQ
ncbi:uncharacterized protein V1516DRAFT_688365 [Lipomyces oligophaga]|uniref:uncharacterized protein n=1 Tax=Lipomyces oligophaga TaxID=45792 RepID=UPI0034CEB95A